VRAERVDFAWREQDLEELLRLASGAPVLQEPRQRDDACDNERGQRDARLNRDHEHSPARHRWQYDDFLGRWVEHIDSLCELTGLYTKGDAAASSLAGENAFRLTYRGLCLRITPCEGFGAPGHVVVAVAIQYTQTRHSSLLSK
jgi:hypothetical protein